MDRPPLASLAVTQSHIHIQDTLGKPGETMLYQGRPFLINCLTLRHDSIAAGWPSVLSIANLSDYSLVELPRVDYLLRPWSVGVADVALVKHLVQIESQHWMLAWVSNLKRTYSRIRPPEY